ncbi:hypothetical protein PLICBS_003715 [Purpureocillium lilacinum]|uniref:uncharacterized protein n=1 Tax=Purpureocillium lilacinum TaxID=33203 RepID=UPI00208D9AEA|nr:hypothetical protein PLICBS_003715 [Purpureocillium lilacinum]
MYKQYTPYCPVPGKHLTVESRPFDPDAPPPPGGITVKNMLLSFDPYQRGQMRRPGDAGTYSLPWVEGQPAVVTTLSTVLKSDNPGFSPGDLVSAMADAGEYAAVPAELAAQTRVYPPLPPGITIAPSALIGALGVAGLSAYVSFNEFVKEPREGKTIFISAASGGVGQVVGQMAKMQGMKVIGSTGSQNKVDFVVNELGFDAAWNYKTEATGAALDRLAPEGLDVYYDNVGGEQLETALTRMKDYGTIVSSGMVSVYNYPDEEKYGIRTGMNIFLKRLTIHGFVCSDPQHLQKYLPTFGPDMVTWLASGKIKTKEEVMVGIDNAPEAMIRMWNGDKFGKMVLKIDTD